MNTYTVKSGDTLQSIAKNVLGDESMTQYLASINNIVGVPGVAGGWIYVISPGQVLNIGVAEITAEKKKVPAAIWIGAGVTIAAVVYWRKDIAAFFKQIF